MAGRLACRALLLAVLILGAGARRLGAGEPALPAPAELVPVTVRDVKFDRVTRAPLVVLQTARKDRFLVIVVGHAEAIAILRRLRVQEAPPRPMTHDLLKSVITTLGGKLDRVVVTRLENGTFYADLIVHRGEATMSVDSRPSDAMALALRMGAAILVARTVLDEAGIAPEQLKDYEAPRPPRRPPIDPKRAI